MWTWNEQSRAMPAVRTVLTAQRGHRASETTTLTFSHPEATPCWFQRARHVIGEVVFVPENKIRSRERREQGFFATKRIVIVVDNAFSIVLMCFFFFFVVIVPLAKSVLRSARLLGVELSQRCAWWDRRGVIRREPEKKEIERKIKKKIVRLLQRAGECAVSCQCRRKPVAAGRGS